MPLEFIELVKGFLPPSTEDRGFLINLNRTRWNNSATTEVMNLLRTYAEPYYRSKCPEEQDEDESEAEGGKGTKKSYCIQFAVRNLTRNNMYCFVACNLAYPEDFAYYLFTTMATDKSFPTPRLPFRILPVQRICTASAKHVEETLMELLEPILGQDNYHPHRFSLIHRSHTSIEGLSYKHTMDLARNCVWATNPTCVQCLKYQDYAIVMEILEPYFYVGVLQDFQKLATYNTWIHHWGLDLKETEPDSEDDISDDPTLSEEEEKQRKLRVKRKRRADRQAQNEQPEKRRTTEKETESGSEEDEGPKQEEEDENETNGLNGSKDAS